MLKHPQKQTGLNSAWYCVPPLPFAFQASRIFGKFDPCRCFRIRGHENVAGLKLPQNMRKHWQGSNFPKIPKILASMGSAVVIVAQIFGKFDPCQCFRISGFRSFGEICSVSMFSHRRLPTSHDPLLTKSRMDHGGGVSVCMYIYI